jgi:hypothetical protein
VATTIRIDNVPATLQVGSSTRSSATVLDQNGRPMSNRSVSWRSTNPGVAAVDNQGTVRAVSEGSAVIVAEAAGKSGTAPLVVTSVPVVRVAVEPSSMSLQVGGGSRGVTATAYGQDGVLGRPITWEGSNRNVADVSPSGQVTPVAAGTATIIATSEGRSASVQVTVAPAAVVVAPPTPANTTATPPAPPEVQIRDLLTAYAAALQSQNVSRVRALYPTMTNQQENATRDALNAMQNLRVQLTASGIAVDGETARAQVTGVWTHKDGTLNIRNTYEFERRQGEWKIVAIR